MGKNTSNMAKKNDGKEFEKLINHLMKFFSGAEIKHNVTKKGIISGRKRQIDNLLMGSIGKIPIEAEIECKDYKHPLSIDKIDCLASKIKDTGVNFGILVGASGFQKSIVEYAKKSNILLFEPMSGVMKNELTTSIGFIVPYIKIYNFRFSGRSSGNGGGFIMPHYHNDDELIKDVRFDVKDKKLSAKELLIYAWNNKEIEQKKGNQIINLNAMTVSFLSMPGKILYMEVKIAVNIDCYYFINDIPIWGLKSVSIDGDKKHYGIQIHLNELEKGRKFIDEEEFLKELETKSQNSDIKNLIVYGYYTIDDSMID